MSIYLGNTEIGQIYLGNTEISEAYLGSTKVFENNPTPPPYDAEIEYLGCTGTQHINTGYYGNLNSRFEVKFKGTATPKYIYGYRGTNTNSITLYNQASSGNCRFGNKTVSPTFSTGVDYTATQDKTALVLNGTSYAYNATTDFATSEPIYLMWGSGNQASGYHFQGNIFYFKVYDNGSLVLDMIPVRVGTTGYMYDIVSGQLFGNAGTGVFILGNDKNT